MARITVLGGCGTVGSVAVRTLVDLNDFSEIVIGDIDLPKADRIVKELGTDRLSAKKVDALNPRSIREAIKGSDVILNCIGPFYKFGPPIVKAAIEARINYVDICDDVDATQAILKMHNQAKIANVSACIGMGSSPGVTNLLAKFCADQLLEKVDAIDIMHCHGGEETEGPGVIAHRIHSMCSEIPMFLDGKYKVVKFFEKEGIALQEDVGFHLIGKHRVYPYPHPETITLPKYIPCQRVTNKGTVIPDEYFQLIIDIVELGMVDEEPLEVKGVNIAPFDFVIAYIIQQREKILRETSFGEQRGCIRTVVSGKRKGKNQMYVFSLASRGQAMGEGTGIPAAFGATLMERGKIKEKGVLPPEACINPLDFLSIMQEYLKLEKISGKGSPLLIESIDAEGKIEHLSL
ncbi:MAG: saccharopine dehydrogenase family protein [Promethearchaeota archaeon]